MNLHYRTVQGHGLDPDTDDLSMLQPLEQSVQHAALGPAVHARIDRMPVAKALWQAAPLAAVFGYIQNGIENLKIRKAYVASLPGQAAFDLLILGFGDFHADTRGFYTRSISETQPLVLTRPRFTGFALPSVASAEYSRILIRCTVLDNASAQRSEQA